jgi:hypothetical protein
MTIAGLVDDPRLGDIGGIEGKIGDGLLNRHQVTARV